MVLRMSISSVPGTNSVFFASLPIDYLSIDRVWERYTGLTRLSSRAGGSMPPLEPEATGDPATFRHDASVHVTGRINCRMLLARFTKIGQNSLLQRFSRWNITP